MFAGALTQDVGRLFPEWLPVSDNGARILDGVVTARRIETGTPIFPVGIACVGAIGAMNPKSSARCPDFTGQ